jgi:hypothetical protein
MRKLPSRQRTEITEAVSRPSHPSLVLRLKNLAESYVGLREYGLELPWRVLGIVEAARGPDNLAGGGRAGPGGESVLPVEPPQGGDSAGRRGRWDRGAVHGAQHLELVPWLRWTSRLIRRFG